MMSARADQACGSDYGERSIDRANQRSGYRARDWDTRAGTVELAVPKLRHGSYFRKDRPVQIPTVPHHLYVLPAGRNGVGQFPVDTFRSSWEADVLDREIGANTLVG